jgi:hypothetical protein
MAWRSPMPACMSTSPFVLRDEGSRDDEPKIVDSVN